MLNGCLWIIGILMIGAGAFMAGLMYGLIVVGLVLLATSVGISEDRKKAKQDDKQNS